MICTIKKYTKSIEVADERDKLDAMDEQGLQRWLHLSQVQNVNRNS